MTDFRVRGLSSQRDARVYLIGCSRSSGFYVADGFNAVMIYNNYQQAAIDFVIVTILAVGILIAAVSVFKWRED
jgi:hypothetical protein